MEWGDSTSVQVDSIPCTVVVKEPDYMSGLLGPTPPPIFDGNEPNPKVVRLKRPFVVCEKGLSVVSDPHVLLSYMEDGSDHMIPL